MNLKMLIRISRLSALVLPLVVLAPHAQAESPATTDSDSESVVVDMEWGTIDVKKFRIDGRVGAYGSTEGGKGMSAEVHMQGNLVFGREWTTKWHLEQARKTSGFHLDLGTDVRLDGDLDPQGGRNLDRAEVKSPGLSLYRFSRHIRYPGSAGVEGRLELPKDQMAVSGKVYKRKEVIGKLELKRGEKLVRGYEDNAYLIIHEDDDRGSSDEFYFTQIHDGHGGYAYVDAASVRSRMEISGGKIWIDDDGQIYEVEEVGNVMDLYPEKVKPSRTFDIKVGNASYRYRKDDVSDTLENGAELVPVELSGHMAGVMNGKVPIDVCGGLKPAAFILGSTAMGEGEDRRTQVATYEVGNVEGCLGIGLGEKAGYIRASARFSSRIQNRDHFMVRTGGELVWERIGGKNSPVGLYGSAEHQYRRAGSDAQHAGVFTGGVRLAY